MARPPKLPSVTLVLPSLFFRLQLDLRKPNASITGEHREMLERVNMSIISVHKSYGSNLENGWISPGKGETATNEPSRSGTHSFGKARPRVDGRRAGVKTATGIGHPVLVVLTANDPPLAEH